MRFHRTGNSVIEKYQVLSNALPNWPRLALRRFNTMRFLASIFYGLYMIDLCNDYIDFIMEWKRLLYDYRRMTLLT